MDNKTDEELKKIVDTLKDAYPDNTELIIDFDVSNLSRDEAKSLIKFLIPTGAKVVKGQAQKYLRVQYLYISLKHYLVEDYMTDVQNAVGRKVFYTIENDVVSFVFL